MGFLSSLDIGRSALSAHRLRMDIITQNIANAETTRTENGKPYTRQMVVMQEKVSFNNVLKDKMESAKYEGVKVTEVLKDDAPYRQVYDPTHPDADENGYVMMPNVDTTKEMIDLMAATRTYEANVTAVNAVKAMALKALSIGK